MPAAEARRERAFLVGVECRTRSRTAKATAKSSLSREALVARDSAASVASGSKTASIPEFSAEESLEELRTLAGSAGAEIAGEFLQHRDRPDPATLIGKGKLEEIAGAAASVSADLLLFDHDLTALQQRNIEKIVHARVIDRTQLILDIFARHARTREGQLQVELAQLEYMLPRLAGRGIDMSNSEAGSAPAALAKLNWRLIAARSTAASVTSNSNWRMCGSFAPSSGSGESPCRSRPSRWWAIPTPESPPCLML